MASIIKRREKWYARVVWRINSKKKEIQIPLKTSSLTTARTRLKKVTNEEKNIRDGITQVHEFKSKFRWLNPEGTSSYESLKLVDVIPGYLKYRRMKQRAGTAEKDYYTFTI